MKRHFYGHMRYYRGRWYVVDAAGTRASVPAYIAPTHRAGSPLRASARGPMVVHSHG